MNKKISVEEFVKGYKSISNDKNKEMYVKKHVVDKYIPYEEKCSICSKIINASMYETIKEKKVFKQDTTSRYMLYSLQLISNYTDISINYKESLNDFNLLDKYGLIDVIYTLISQSEKSKIDTILQMKLDDFYENNRSTTSFLNDAIFRIQNVITTFIEKIGIEELDQRKIDIIKEKINNKLK